MKIIGFNGGHTLYEIGTTSDVVLFFECIDYFVVKKYPDQDWSLLTDRLYRRYLRLEELDHAAKLMSDIQKVFLNLPSTEVDWKSDLIGDESKTWLNPNQMRLADVFIKFFENFNKAKGSAESFFDVFKIYQPIKTIRTDLAGSATEDARPLREYDELEGRPFWLR